MQESEKIEKYKKAWEKFQDKMASLRKRRHDFFVRISEKLDKQKIDKLRDKLKNQ
jgi:hypothetical protein